MTAAKRCDGMGMGMARVLYVRCVCRCDVHAPAEGSLDVCEALCRVKPSLSQRPLSFMAVVLAG
jgi:hypothetical protein